MAANYLSLEALAPALAKNALILVPNNRLRNQLLRTFAAKQTSQAWLKPNIQSLSQWLDNLWDTLQNHAIPYSCVSIAAPLQRQILWEMMIKNSPTGSLLLQPKALAQQADSALKNLELWQLLDDFLNTQYHDKNINSSHFLEWLKEFKQKLTLQKSITREHAHTLLLRAFAEGSLTRYDEIYLEGFDDLPPLFHNIIEAATEHSIKLPNQKNNTPLLTRTQTKTAEDEIRAAALWSKSELEKAPDTAFIGIVVPNLGQCRAQVERIFQEVYEAHSILPKTARYTLPFNFSAGIPLGSAPLICTLFDILQLQQEKNVTDLCNILQSPFWGDESKEYVARAHLMKELRRLNRLSISPTDLRYCAKKLEERIPCFAESSLSTRFENLGNLLRGHSGKKTASEWLAMFDQTLEIMGWPGTRRLDSQEFQQITQWSQVRDEFCNIDNYSAPITYSKACRYLRELADKTPFQAQTPDSLIQILGALEAAGLQFSHLWVMGLSDNQWPPLPAPNPLLPLDLQRTFNMPHASATRELEIAQGLTHRYRESAQHVIFSSAHTDADNEQRPSALIRDIPLTDIEHILQNRCSDLQNYYQHILNSSKLDIIHDSHGPEFTSSEVVRGGSSLFKYQASCPFEAFVRLRLGAKNPDEPSLGFSASERGSLLHESLASIWRELNNSNNLKKLEAQQTYEFVSNITQAIILKEQTRNPRKLGKQYCALEHKRLTQLLCEWLEQEKARPSFKVVAIEQEDEIQFSGLTLKLRLDRIDEYTNGDRLLIDYKTGSVNSKSWLEERTTEPQLPLYAITNENISAISFAQINRKSQKWDGIGNLQGESQYQEGIKPIDNWPQQLHEWQQQLQQLANDFIIGDARIDFKNTLLQEYAADLAPLTRLADADALMKFAQVNIEHE